MPNQKNRVIVDSNIWISFLLTGTFSQLENLILNTDVTILYSEELINEFVEVAQRDKFKKYFDIEDVENLLIQIKNHSEFVTITSEVYACRDPKDNFLLSLTVDGKATHLITGDKDLLVIKKFGNTQILTLKEYLIDK